MRIYFNMRDRNLIADGFKDIEKTAKPEALKMVKIFIEMAIESRHKYMIQKCEAMKYKVMWVLRDLEEEMDAESEGLIFIGDDFDVRGFSTELFQKIVQRIMKITKE